MGARGKLRGALATAFAAGALALGIASAGAATMGPVTDPIGVVRVPKGAPIIIGGYWVSVRA